MTQAPYTDIRRALEKAKRVESLSLSVSVVDAEAILADAERWRAIAENLPAITRMVQLGAQYMEVVAGDRAKAGHHGLGTIRSTLYDSEVADRDTALLAIRNLTPDTPTDKGSN